LGDAETRTASIDGGELMESEPKLKPTDLQRLQREAERLIATGEMPSLQQVLEAVAEAQKKYADQIRAARAEGGDNSEQ
jgi:hypothetical protein